MEKRNLGRTDIRVSEISLGTWGLAGQAYGKVTDETFEATVKAALGAGITTFDMAPAWGHGRGEEMVAKVVGPWRDEVVYITRTGVHEDEHGGIEQRFDPLSIRDDVEASLKRLDTDRIDVLLMHNPDETLYETDDWQREIEKLTQAGKVRTWGVSVGDQVTARDAIGAGAKVICLVHNALAATDLQDLTAEISVAGCGVLARSPLAYGVLSGRWNQDRKFAAIDHRAERWSFEALRVRAKQVQKLRFLIHDGVTSLTDAAIRFVLHNATVSSCVSGARSAEQIREVCKAAEAGAPYLPAEDVAKVYQLLPG